MELKIILYGIQNCNEVSTAKYTIQEDNADLTAVIHLIPSSEKGEIILDKLGVEDLIEVLTIFKSRI